MEHYPTCTRKRLLILATSMRGFIPWEIRKLGVAKLRSMGFTNITDEDVRPHRDKYKKRERRLGN